MKLAVSRSLGAYFLARFSTAAAMTLFRATLAWDIYARTDSSFALGLMGAIQFIPALVFVLPGGMLADVWPRPRVMIVAQAAMIGAGLALWLWVRGVWSIAGIGTEMLYVFAFLMASAYAFDGPARVALLPQLVEKAAFPKAVTVGSTNQALAFATGPALAGALIYRGGVELAYGFFVVLIALALGALPFVRPLSRAVPRGISVGAMFEGVQYVWRKPVLLGCMSLDMFAVIFGGATALLPVYASDILGVGPRGYGVLSSALDVGAIATSLVLIFIPAVRRSGRALLFAVGGYGLATIAFGLSRWVPLSIAMYMLVGVMDQISVVMRGTMVQLETPDELRGRVSSVNLLFIGASNQLGAMESGFVAAATSPTFAVVSGGLGCLVVLAITAYRNRALRTYEVGHSSI